MLRIFAALVLTTAVGQTGGHPEHGAAPAAGNSAVAATTSFFPRSNDAAAQLDLALAKAKAETKRAVIVFGADWCHDSRALAAALTSKAYESEFGNRYAVTFIDVGRPQTGEGHNLDLVERLGVKSLKSTPAMFVIGPDGTALNDSKDAVSWRNAESRGTAKILSWFRDLR